MDRRAEAFLEDLREDARTAPPEFLFLVEDYRSRLEETLRLYREGRLDARQLEAGLVQIRLSYARDLSRLFPVEVAPAHRWTYGEM